MLKRIIVAAAAISLFASILVMANWQLLLNTPKQSFGLGPLHVFVRGEYALVVSADDHDLSKVKLADEISRLDNDAVREQHADMLARVPPAREEDAIDEGPFDVPVDRDHPDYDVEYVRALFEWGKPFDLGYIEKENRRALAQHASISERWRHLNFGVSWRADPDADALDRKFTVVLGWLSPAWIGLPAMLILIVAALRHFRRRRRRVSNACPHCGYSLQGLASDWCPECGAAVQPA